MNACFYLLLLLLFISCTNQQSKDNITDSIVTVTPTNSADVNSMNEKEICWTGTLNGKTPVFIHYQLDSNVIVGEITYLNTKAKLPIPLIGTIEKDGTYRLLEFEKSGNITGIITGQPTEQTFAGSWISPKTEKELTLNLVKKDTVVHPRSITTNIEDLFGSYHYQYSEEGYVGDFVISRLANSKASFGITSVTGAPARNVAQIEDDTITLTKPHFIYSLPDTDDCEFEVKFYKRFAYIRYTKGFCDGQFGLNAGVDGIFLKTD